MKKLVIILTTILTLVTSVNANTHHNKKKMFGGEKIKITKPHNPKFGNK